MRSRPKRTDDEPKEDKTLARRFERRVGLSRFALGAERAWEALLWPFVVVALFLIISLFELWSLLPPLMHRLLLGGFGIAFLVSLLPLVRIDWPSRQEALRRLERDAEIKHRPASSYEDRLGATASTETALLWAGHRERLAKLIASLKPRWPDPRSDRNDPYALRTALLLVLVIAFVAAGDNGWDRLRQAFTPSPGAATALLRLDAWVAPPVYTKQPPIVLADGTEPVGAGAESFRALSVPARSELIVRAHSPQGESVTLVTAKDDGTAPAEVKPKDSASPGLVAFSVALTEPGTAEVKIDGNVVAKWRFALIEDELPTINLVGNPTTTPRSALRLAFRAHDDHGVASAEAHFALAEGQLAGAPAPPAEPGAKPDPLLEPPVMVLQLPRANAKDVEGRASQDLTAHPWAGLKVSMTLAAHDQAGQTGTSVPYEFILPERKFTKPLAKAVVEQRRKLVRETDAAPSVARALDALTLGGEKVIDNSAVYLALRNAFWRLESDESRESIASVVGQLWDIALKIEDGDLPEAERAVKDAQDQLSAALEKNASPEEIDRLVEELRKALSKYLQALAEQAKQKGNAPPEESQNGDQLVSQQDLDKMLKNIEQLAKSGSKDLAQRMLSELKDILDRLQTGNFPNNAEQQRAAQMMKELSDLVGKQQKLLDDTFGAKRKQGGNEDDAFEVSPPGQPMEWGPGIMMAPLFETPENEGGQEGDAQGSPDSQGKQGKQGQNGHGAKSKGQFGELGKRQGDLRDQLQSMIDRLNMEGTSPPDEFKGAGDAMGDAKDAIGEPDLDHATQAQNLALDRLRKGAQSMAQQQNQDNGEAQGQNGKGKTPRDMHDPLGRPDRTNRPDLGLDVKVPDEIDIQRAREVLDELRRRLGDPSRPTLELDYLERLIRPY